MRVFRNLSRDLSIITLASAVLIGSVFAVTGANVNAASKPSSIKVVKATKPAHQVYKNFFPIKGKVMSSHTLISVRCGVRTLKNKWVNHMHVSVNPKSKSYDLLEADSKLKFGRLKPGTYYYYLDAKSTVGKRKILIKHKFTISHIYGKKISKPDSKIVKGTPVTLSGKANSTFGFKKIYIGVTTNSGKWLKGFYHIRKTRKNSYNVSKVDHLIRFGRLSTGTYRYRIKATDKYGVTKLITNKKFKVVSSFYNTNSSYANAATGSVKKKGFRLSYKGSLISQIGRQPVSGPCGQYAMAYCRAILDGRFPLKRKYGSYYSQLYNEYGLGSHYAYWYKANGSPVWYSSNKGCYKAALKEITKGRPCVINLHNNYTGNNHFVTVIGYIAGTTYSNVSLSKFIAIDPGYGTQVYLKDMNYSGSDNPEAVFF